MSYALEIAGNDLTDYIRDQSITSKVNTLDLALIDPPYPPLVGDEIHQSDPDWDGFVVRVVITDTVERGSSTLFTVSAVNSDPLVTAASPFDLSDNPNYSTTFPWRELSTETVRNTDGSTDITGRCTVFEPGLRAGQTIELTSVNHGFSAFTFTITQVTVRWPAKEPDPTYLIEFGDQATTLQEVIHNPAPTCQPDTIVGATTVWHATYDAHDNDVESNTYDFGLERTTIGGFGDYAPAAAFFGGSYGRNNAGAFASQKMPWTASNDCSFSMDILWQYTPSNRDVSLLWYNVTNDLLRTDVVITGAGHATDTGYSNLGSTVTPPVTSTQVQISYTNFAGLFGDNIALEIPGSIVAANNSPYCLPAGPGSSPHPLLSDDPRLASLEAQIAALEAGAVAGLGSWTAYTPTLTAVTTNPTLGSSTLIGRYKGLDPTTYIVEIRLGVVTGGAWNAGSGEWKFSLPSGLTANATIDSQGSVAVLDSGTARFAGTAIVAASGTVIWPIIIADSTGDRVLKHNNPVTWATGDTVNVQVLVEVQ